MTEAARPLPELMDRNRVLLDRADAFVYKETEQGKLEAFVFQPETPAATPRPALAFFFSSQWDTGLVSQFAPHALHFAQRGLTSVIFDYRTSAKHNTSPLAAMADARTAIRWLRSQSEALGIDPERIGGVGGSAGAQLLLSAAMCGPEFSEPTESEEICHKPAALVLFSPVVDVVSPDGVGAGKFSKESARAANPLSKIKKGLPPMLIIHGTADRLVPFVASQKFAKKATGLFKRNQVELVPFEGQGQGFFNFNVEPQLFEATLQLADSFLTKLGWLEPLEGPPETGLGLRLASDGRIKG